MIRLLHFADFHLGMETYGRIDPETGLSSRVMDFLSALDRLVDYALSEDIHLVVFAGDAYKNRDPNPTYEREFATRILRMSRAGIPVVLIVGNHDLPPAQGRASTVDAFTTFQAENVYVGRTIETLRIETRGGPVQVVTLPWILRSRFLTKEQTQGKSLTEIDNMLIESVDSILAREKSQLAPDIPAVLAAHATVTGAQFGSERTIMLGQDIVLALSDLGDSTFDYVALGHIHKHQVLREVPPVVYAGSLERVDFGEEKEDKGFMVAEVERGSARYRFHSTDPRRMVTIRVDAQSDNPTPEVLDAIEKERLDDAIVRLFIRLSEDQNLLLDQSAVMTALGRAFYVASVVRDVERPVRYRLGTATPEELSPEQILSRYLEAKQVPKDKAEDLLQKGSEILRQAMLE